MLETMPSTADLEKEIEKTRNYLHRLESRLPRGRYRKVDLKQVEAELRAKYPKSNPDRELLSFVGTLSKPSVGYKEAVRQIVAERYGR